MIPNWHSSLPINKSDCLICCLNIRVRRRNHISSQKPIPPLTFQFIRIEPSSKVTSYQTPLGAQDKARGEVTIFLSFMHPTLNSKVSPELTKDL